MLTLARYIHQHVDSVVDEFEIFARTSGPGADLLSSKDLRDHAVLVLQAVAADMAMEQSPAAQRAKAEGHNQSLPSVIKDAARLHARHRFEQGFTLPQMMSEYRALRASVIRRWTDQPDSGDDKKVDELTRFGEAIDEAVTEAVRWYSKGLEDSRNLLIGIMAHDLRTPLSAVKMSAQYLLRTDRLLDGELRAATRIATSSDRMASYVDDLLDFTQTLLGAGLPVVRAPLNLTALCLEVIDELKAAHPGSTLQLEAQGTTTGSWDGDRLAQLLSNLVTNAIFHGQADSPITISISETDGMVVLAVHNHGDPIPADALPTLLYPLRQGGFRLNGHNGSSGLGLGLHIAREIATAHGGSLTVVSEADAGTTFTALLPFA